jgi:hypothetical protein
LISGGNNNELKCVSAISTKDVVYKSSLTGVRSTDIKVLREISGLLNSSFFAYLNIQTFSSTGIEREESHDDEKLNMPFMEINDLENLVTDVEQSFIRYYDSESILSNALPYEIIKKKLNQIDRCIYDSFACTNEERELLNHTNEITLPIMMRHSGYENLFQPLKIKDAMLKDYASLFINYFSKKIETKVDKFLVEIWYTNQIVGMFFKLVPVTKFKEEIVWIDKRNSDSSVIATLVKLSSEKITDKLFVQKDIRGFEKDVFYIFKPNEKRLWHKAIGYLDLNEFADAILIAGRDST